MLGRYKKSVLSLFRRVHELEADRGGNRLLALEIQEELLARISRAERRIRKARAANVEVKRSRSQRGNTRDASARLKGMHQRGLHYISIQKSLITALRSIGDAVAFNIRIELTDSAWKIVSLEPNDSWGERYVIPRAVGHLAGEFVSLRWFIDHMLLGQMAETMSRLIQESQ
jgi:hypothetical protein